MLLEFKVLEFNFPSFATQGNSIFFKKMAESMHPSGDVSTK